MRKSNIIERECNDIKYSHMIREIFRVRVVTDTIATLGFIQGREFFIQTHDNQRLKKHNELMKQKLHLV